MEADLPSSRGSKPSQWGAFHWLWAPQDNRELPTDKEGDPTTSLHLEAKEGAGLLVTPRFQAVQDLIQSSYAKYLTRTGKTSSASPILNIEKDLQDFQERIDELKVKIKKVDDDKQRLEELQKGLPSLLTQLEKTKDEHKKARTEEIDFSSIESQLKVAEASVKEAERDEDDAGKALDALEKSAENVDRIQDKLKKAKGKLPKLEALNDQLEKRQRDIKKKVEERAIKIRECEELVRDARILWTKADDMKKIEELKKKIKRVKEVDGKIENLRKKEVLVVPTTKEIEGITQSQMRIETLRESLVARGLSVNVNPGKKGSLEVEVDGEKLKKGETSTTGTESVNVKASGLGEVIVNAKLEKAKDAKVDIQNLETSVRDGLNKYDVSSIDGLKEINRNQMEIKNNIKELVAERRGVEERSIDELAIVLEKLKEKFDGYKEFKRSAMVKKLNATDINLERLVKQREKEEGESRDDLDAAREERDEVDKLIMSNKEKLTEVQTEEKHLSKGLDSANIQEREVIRKFGSQEHQEKLLKLAKSNLKLRKEGYDKLKQKYDELEKGPINRIKRLEHQIDNQEKIIRQQQSSTDLLKGSIGTESLSGAYSELAESELQMEIFNERFEKEKIRVEAIKLLKESLESQYRSVLSTVVGPIQDEVKRSLSYVTGFLHEEVELNEYLFPIKLGERGLEDISLEFNDGSSGLKEALTLCIRLAVAKHLSTKDSQCLAFDDPFVHVSSNRSNKMIELINEAIKECALQVIVFTHRQMEFAGFSGKMVDIQQARGVAAVE